MKLTEICFLCILLSSFDYMLANLCGSYGTRYIYHFYSTVTDHISYYSGTLLTRKVMKVAPDKEYIGLVVSLNTEILHNVV